MPEGDTIFRTAASLRRWIGGREVTGARSVRRGVALERVVGTTVDRVEPKAKHLLIGFSNGWVLHTHMRMTGSWHVYPAGERWQRPAHQARVVIECGDRVAVCFNAPVVELLEPSDERQHRALGGLGPDVLADPFDLGEVVRRSRAQPPATTMGELLLDQRVVSGIGNIYRCESLFVDRINPWTTVGALDDAALVRVVTTASRLMRANVGAARTIARETGGGSGRPWVYRRAGRPCRRCRSLIRGGRLGAQARTIYWCPSCQPVRTSAS
jgi:endonuclease-8